MPALTTHDPADLLLAYAELSGKLTLIDATSMPSGLDFFDLSQGQPVHPMVLSGVVRLAQAALGDGILHVVALGAEPPMPVVLAGPEVTSMADLNPYGDRADSVLVAPDVGTHHASGPVGVLGAIPEQTVALQLGMPWEGPAGSCPGPAVVRAPDIDLGPVALLDGDDGPSTHYPMIEQASDDVVNFA